MSDYFLSKPHFYNVITDKEKKILIKLGERVKLLREERNLSQFQLANEAEIPKTQIGRIERAEINTTYLTLYKIATALKVNLKELIQE